MSSSDVLVQAAPQLLSATVGSSLLLLDRWSGATAILDPGTAMVWTSAVASPATATEIAEAIASDLGGTGEDHLPHVRRAIASLLDEGLLLDSSTRSVTDPVAGVILEPPPAEIPVGRRSRIVEQVRRHPQARTDMLTTGSHSSALVTFDDDLQRYLRSKLGGLVAEPATDSATDLDTQGTNRLPDEPDHQLAVVGSRRSDLPFRLLIDGLLKHRAS